MRHDQTIGLKPLRGLYARFLSLVGALLVVTAALLSTPVHADGVLRIAAVVNDEIISIHDLNLRMIMVMNSSDMPKTAEVQKRIAPQVLRMLIDEKIKSQEADRRGVKVTQKDLDNALGRLAQQNNATLEDFDRVLQKSGIPKEALVGKVESEIAWAKFVNRRLRTKVKIGADEIDDAIARIQANKGQPEYLVSEIYLPVEDLERQNDIKNLASKLIEQLSKGAAFEALARNFSQSASAGVGGDLGWISAGQLDPELDAALKTMNPKDIAGPVETPLGYYILNLRNRRMAQGLPVGDVKVELQQLVAPIQPGSTIEQINALASQVHQQTAALNGCAALEEASKPFGSPMSGNLGMMSLSALPDDIRQAVSDLDENTPSQPVQTQAGVTVFMVCKRDGNASEDAVRSNVKKMLINERLEMLARRQVRNLRREAFVDIRL